MVATQHLPNVELLIEVAEKQGAISYGEFTLSSGRKSSYYFDGRLLSLDPEGADALGKALVPILVDAGVTAVGGPTLGADPIVTAVAMTSWQQRTPLPAFIVRKEPKEHGTTRMIEGHAPEDAIVAIVDDTCTTGASLFHAIAAAKEAGCKVGLVLAVLDRDEGGSEDIRKAGYRFEALLKAGPDGKIHPA